MPLSSKISLIATTVMIGAVGLYQINLVDAKVAEVSLWVGIVLCIAAIFVWQTKDRNIEE